MSDEYITIREATELTGKAEITIRRLIRRLIKQMTNQKTPEANQMIRQEQQGRGFIYKISRDYLLKELKVSDLSDKIPPKEKKEIPKKGIPENREKTGRAETPEIVREVIETLKSQILIKDKQIDSLSNKIDQLIERDRETNIILKGLQDRVFLLEGAKMSQNKQNEVENEPEAVETTNKEPQKAKKEPTSKPRGRKKAKKTEGREKPKKRGFLSRLFSGGYKIFKRR